MESLYSLGKHGGTMKNSTLIFILGFIWSVVGIALSLLGMKFLFKANAFLFFFLALPLGYIKGRTVLKKSAHRQVVRAQKLKQPSVKDIFTRGYMILIGVMMCLGMLLRFCPLALRGTIDLAVGFGLIVGSSYYYRAIKTPLPVKGE